jgi:hypothetical protein
MARRLFIFNSEIAPLLRNVLLFAFVVISLDQFLGYQLDNVFNKKVLAGTFGTINRAVQEKGDIIILGDSKAHHNYIPAAIGQNLSASCYNLGNDGMGIIYHYTLITHVLSHYKPKLIIYDVSGGEFNEKFLNRAYYKLMPIIKQYDEIIDIVRINDTYIKLKLLSRLYPYNKKLHSLIKDGFILQKDDPLRGYVPLYGSNVLPYRKKSAESQSQTQDSIILQDTFKAFIKKARDNNVPLVSINSPVWDFNDYYPHGFPDAITNLFARNNINLIVIQKTDYKSLTNASLFKDMSHLNHEGALVFSEIVNSKLIELKQQRYF